MILRGRENVKRKVTNNDLQSAVVGGSCLLSPATTTFFARNEAIEAELVEQNPATRLGRFTRTTKTPDVKGICLIQEEVRQFLEAANDVCPEYYPLFLTALRAGLRRAELVALQ